MEEEMEVEKILEVSQMMHLSSARFLWKPCFPKTASAKVPATRFKHTTVLYKGYIYLLGGRGKQNTFKDLWKYYIDDNTWEKIQVEGPGPPALQEHSAVIHGEIAHILVSLHEEPILALRRCMNFSEQDSVKSLVEQLSVSCMYVFGGVVASDTTIPLWCLDLEQLRWKKLPATKTGPKNRRGHSASIFYDSMYVFGGFIDIRGAINEFWRYDLETNGWTLIKPQHSRSETIPPRYSHASSVYNNALWVFGGFEGLERKNDLWRWDFELSFWNKIKFRQGPPPLTGHSMVKASGNIIIFGGEDNSGLNNQLWRYSFETYKWTKVYPYGGIGPPVRSYHTMIVLSPFMTFGVPSQNVANQERTVDDYFIRKNSGSKRSFGSKSNSADNILCTDREAKPVTTYASTSKPRNLTRPRSVIEQVCDNLQDMEALTPVEVSKGSTFPPSLDSIQNSTVSTESSTGSGRKGMFQVGGNDTEMVDENIYYNHRQGWSLLLIGGKGKMSVEMHKTSLDVWQCDIGETSDIPPVNEPKPTSWNAKKDIFSIQPGEVTYDRFDSPPSPQKSSKRKLQSYDLLEVTDISDEVCFESSPEQRPKLQENRRLLER